MLLISLLSQVLKVAFFACKISYKLQLRHVLIRGKGIGQISFVSHKGKTVKIDMFCVTRFVYHVLPQNWVIVNKIYFYSTILQNPVKLPNLKLCVYLTLSEYAFLVTEKNENYIEKNRGLNQMISIHKVQCNACNGSVRCITVWPLQ